MRLPWLITTLLALGVPRGAIMLAMRGKTHFCNARSRNSEVYFNLLLRSVSARLYSLPANLRLALRVVNERFTFNVISVRGA